MGIVERVRSCSSNTRCALFRPGVNTLSRSILKMMAGCYIKLALCLVYFGWWWREADDLFSV